MNEDKVFVENSITWLFDMSSVNHNIVPGFVDTIKPLSLPHHAKGSNILLTNLKIFFLDNTA